MFSVLILGEDVRWFWSEDTERHEVGIFTSKIPTSNLIVFRFPCLQASPGSPHRIILHGDLFPSTTDMINYLNIVAQSQEVLLVSNAHDRFNTL